MGPIITPADGFTAFTVIAIWMVVILVVAWVVLSVLLPIAVWRIRKESILMRKQLEAQTSMMAPARFRRAPLRTSGIPERTPS
jgi:hypothetical protein